MSHTTWRLALEACSDVYRSKSIRPARTRVATLLASLAVATITTPADRGLDSQVSHWPPTFSSTPELVEPSPFLLVEMKRGSSSRTATHGAFRANWSWISRVRSSDWPTYMA